MTWLSLPWLPAWGPIDLYFFGLAVLVSIYKWFWGTKRKEKKRELYLQALPYCVDCGERKVEYKGSPVCSICRRNRKGLVRLSEMCGTSNPFYVFDPSRSDSSEEQSDNLWSSEPPEEQSTERSIW